MALETVDTSKIYLSIVKGNLVQKVEEGAEGARKRVYEKSDGSSGEKWELTYKSVSGYLSNLTFKDSEFGEKFVIELTDGEEKYQIKFPSSGSYFADFGKKISDIHLDLPITINPYDFTTKEGKKKTGLFILQEGQKLTSTFWDADKKKVLGDFPQPTDKGKGFDSDDWKVYFISVKKFLKEHIQKVWGGHQPNEAPEPQLQEEDDF